jgi:hypothetical protein
LKITFKPISSGLDKKSEVRTDWHMNIFQSTKPLIWGELDVPMFGLTKDWFGVTCDSVPGFSLVMDPQRLWFIVNHRGPAELHPRSRPGIFLAELWRYDVAELFLSDPISGRYFEFNLAPNGAWWTCEFISPRVRVEEVDIAMPEVSTHAELAPDGSWVAAMAIPLNLLKARLDFGLNTRANVTMIVESPEQRFFSACDLGTETPDFHRPKEFSVVNFVSIPN